MDRPVPSILFKFIITIFLINIITSFAFSKTKLGNKNNLEKKGKCIFIPPLETGSKIILNYHGVPSSVRRFFPKYTNAYISVVDDFDYRYGIPLIGTANVSEKIMLRAREIINIVLLSNPQISKDLSGAKICIALIDDEPEPDSELVKAILSLRPVELIYTDINGINEVGMGDEPSSIPEKLIELWAHYPLRTSPDYFSNKEKLYRICIRARKNKIFNPDTKYLEPDFAHPGIPVVYGAYLSRAYKVYHNIKVNGGEYIIVNSTTMKTKDPLMYEFLKFTKPAWYNFKKLKKNYTEEIKKLRKMGII